MRRYDLSIEGIERSDEAETVEPYACLSYLLERSYVLAASANE